MGSPVTRARDASQRAVSLTRVVWVVSLPIILVQIGETLVQVTDTVFLGRLGEVELAAIALANTIWEAWIVLITGLVEALLIVIARRAGQGYGAAIGAVFDRGLLLAIAASLGLAVGLELAAPALAGHLGTSAAVADAIDDYLRIAAVGIVFYSITLVYTAFYIGIGRTRPLIITSLMLVLANLVLSYVLIFGELGLPRLGIRGAAIAGVGADLATSAFLVAHSVRRTDLRRYRLHRLSPTGDPVVRTLLRIAAPVSLQALVEELRWFGFFIIVGQVSVEALASSSIVYALYEVLLIPALAFSETTFSMVSSVIGRGQSRQIGVVMRRVIAASYTVTLPFLVAAAVLPGPTISLFGSDGASVPGSVDALRVVTLAILVVIPALLWSAAVSGTGDTDAALVIEVLLTGVMIASAYVMADVLHLPLAIIWLSVPLAWLLDLALAYWWVRAGYWRRRRF